MKKRVVILGGGPNRIGQGIEFDYCCCHAAYALQEIGYEAIIVNSNPETVSTDYDTSDRLYFEPLTEEDVLNILEKEQPEGVIVQLGGQTPLNLAIPLEKKGIKILGTSSDSIDRAEDRERFKQLLEKLGLKQPLNSTVFKFDEAKKVAHKIDYPVLVRPSYVLGGRGMEIIYNDQELEEYLHKATLVSSDHPILIDKFLEDAIEIDVDMISDGETFVVAGILEHIEEAGIHSGDSAMVLPPHSLSQLILNEIRTATIALAKELNVKGLMNIQYAYKDEEIYLIEVNPRASRTVPFISKAIGVPLAKLATKIMLGYKLKDLDFTKEVVPPYYCVKESVFPFTRFLGSDVFLSPEMRSTGEVMGVDKDYGKAFAKAQIAAGQNLPKKGNVFISVKNNDKNKARIVAQDLYDLGFKIYATSGTAASFRDTGILVVDVPKIHEKRPHIVDLIKSGDIDLLINTPSGSVPQKDQSSIRTAAVLQGVPLVTTISGAEAVVCGIEALIKEDYDVKPIQEYHQIIKNNLNI
ncbi:MAG: carbamoyl-phosphate synthase large subunit [bacterium]|nr:carbamoyl-phosphate synthase large subunit [bacterium]